MYGISAKRDYFDDVAPRWVRDTDLRSAQLQHVFNTYDIPKAGPVLDIGSGAGIMLPFLREKSSGSSAVIELEISPGMLRMARSLHGVDAHTGYVQADAHRIPFPDSYFATAMCFSVYPHFNSPDVALREIRRCLQKEGRLCILHLMGHTELNAMHREAGNIVADDIIPPACILAERLRGFGFEPYQIREQSDLYLILATAA